MKVILLKDVKGTGTKDQVLEVSDGFARNFLLPRKAAIEATAEALNAIEKAKQAVRHREDLRLQEAEKQARDLKGKVVNIAAKMGEGGKLYGSITVSEIAEALEKQLGTTIDKRKIELDEPIRTAGQTLATLKLSPGVSTRIIVNVTAVVK